MTAENSPPSRTMDVVSTALSIRFSTPAEEERARRFLVHKNYITSIAMFLERSYRSERFTMLEGLLLEHNQLSGIRKIQRRKQESPQMTRCLLLSWASEIQFRLASHYDRALIQFSNAWAPIHAYYSIYSSAHAWICSMGDQHSPDNHTAVLRTLSNQMVQREIFPAPWNVLCRGCPEVYPPIFDNSPNGMVAIPPKWLLARPTAGDFWPRYLRMLEATRRRTLSRAYHEWKRRMNRKRMNKSVKSNLAASVPATTLFDYLYGLRVRANYRDAMTYMMGDQGVPDQERFQMDYRTLIECTNMLFENLVARYSGKQALRARVEEFVHSHRDAPEPLLNSIRTRMELITQS